MLALDAWYGLSGDHSDRTTVTHTPGSQTMMVIILSTGTKTTGQTAELSKISERKTEEITDADQISALESEPQDTDHNITVEDQKRGVTVSVNTDDGGTAASGAGDPVKIETAAGAVWKKCDGDID